MRFAAMTCEHHYCRCARAAELLAMDRIQDAIAVHFDRVTCRLAPAPDPIIKQGSERS